MTIDSLPTIEGGLDARPTALPARTATLELMRHGLLEARDKPALYQALLAYPKDVASILGPLNLACRLDEVRGLAYLTVMAGPDTSDDEWSHPLVRRQRLTLEQSLLVAILRQRLIAHELDAGVGAQDASVALEDLQVQLQSFLGDLGSDAQERKRLLTLLEQLKVHGMVSDIDHQERVSIRPIVAHVLNPENLSNLIEALRALATGAAEGQGEA